jgi:hypothetical protein
MKFYCPYLGDYHLDAMTVNKSDYFEMGLLGIKKQRFRQRIEFGLMIYHLF